MQNVIDGWACGTLHLERWYARKGRPWWVVTIKMKQKVAVVLFLAVLAAGCDDFCWSWGTETVCSDPEGADGDTGEPTLPVLDGMTVCGVVEMLSGDMTCLEQVTLGGLDVNELPDGDSRIDVHRDYVYGAAYTYEAEVWPYEGAIGRAEAPTVATSSPQGVREGPSGSGYLWAIGWNGVCPDAEVHRGASVTTVTDFVQVGQFGSGLSRMCVAEEPGGITGVRWLLSDPIMLGFRLGTGPAAADENDVILINGAADWRLLVVGGYVTTTPLVGLDDGAPA